MDTNKDWEEQRQAQLINIVNKEGQLTVSSREVAINFGKRNGDVLEKIDSLISEMNSTDFSVQYFMESSYKDSSGKMNKEYLLTRDGFSLLVMGFTGAKALQWKLKYIEAFNKMEHKLKEQQLNTTQLSPELQMFNSIFNAVAKVELSAKELKQEVQAIKEHNQEELQNMRDVITLDPNSWREDCKKLIHKIAYEFGGSEHIRLITKEIYSLMDSRLGSRLDVRRRNKRRRMADEGVCKSKRDKLSYVDVIGDDKKLIEGYKAIVKEMAIKYGVA